MRDQVSSRILTIPNVLSVVRLALIPVFLVLLLEGQDVLALAVLVISSVTDYLDGILARKLGQVSRLGQLLDPAADRIFIFTTLIGLAVRGIIPWWLLAVVVGRDVMLLVLGVVLANFGYGPIPVHNLGKMATFCLLLGPSAVHGGPGVPGGGHGGGTGRLGVRAVGRVSVLVGRRHLPRRGAPDHPNFPGRVAPRIGYAGTPREVHDG